MNCRFLTQPQLSFRPEVPDE